MTLSILKKKFDELNERERRIRLVPERSDSNKVQRFLKELRQSHSHLEIKTYNNKPHDLNDIAYEDGFPNRPLKGQIAGQEQSRNNSPMSIGKIKPSRDTSPTAVGQHRSASNLGTRPGSIGSANGSLILQFLSPIGNKQISFDKLGNSEEQNKKAVAGPIKVTSNATFQNFSKKAIDEGKEERDTSQGISRKMRPRQLVAWKNKRTEVENNSKQFYANQLMFDLPHSDMKIVSSDDLEHLWGNKSSNMLQASRLRSPKNQTLDEIPAFFKRMKDLENHEKKLERQRRKNAKTNFNESLSYINLLRTSTPTELKKEDQTILEMEKPIQTKPSKPYAVVRSRVDSPADEDKKSQIDGKSLVKQRIYFSSLSDARKKNLFKKLYILQSPGGSKGNFTKQVQLLDSEKFSSFATKQEGQNLYLQIVDLITFDYVNYDIELDHEERLRVKEKGEPLKISDVYKQFMVDSRSNLVLLAIYYESAQGKLTEVVSRIVILDDNAEFKVWKNIYRFLLHKMILANSSLYPGLPNYADLSKAVKEIMEDQRDFISPIAGVIQKWKNHSVLVEQNENLYRFDFHSYALEYSAFFSRLSLDEHRKLDGNSRGSTKSPDGRFQSQVGKSRPYSAFLAKKKLSFSQIKKTRPSQESIDSTDMFESALRISSYKVEKPLNSIDNSVQDKTMQHPEFSSFFNESTMMFDDREKRGNSVFKRETESMSQSINSRNKQARAKNNLDVILQGDKIQIYRGIQADRNARKSENTSTIIHDQSNAQKSNVSDQQISTLVSTASLKKFSDKHAPNQQVASNYMKPLKKKINITINMKSDSFQKQLSRMFGSENSMYMKSESPFLKMFRERASQDNPFKGK